jgi:hypothetical protein
MTMIRYAVLGAALAGVMVTGVIVNRAHADKQPAEIFSPGQGMIHTTGSTHTIGYFLQKDGACALTLFTKEATSLDEDRLPKATRMRVSIKPGEKVELSNDDGKEMQVVCGANASTVEVHQGVFHQPYMTQ